MHAGVMRASLRLAWNLSFRSRLRRLCWSTVNVLAQIAGLMAWRDIVVWRGIVAWCDGTFDVVRTGNKILIYNKVCH